MKMCGSTDVESATSFKAPGKTVHLKMGQVKTISEKPRQLKPRKRMSNDPQLQVKVFCGVCDQVYQMSGLRKHVAHKHGLTLTRYREMFGDLRKQIIQLVHHACVLCKRVLLLDTEDISKHVSKKHKMGYTSYARRFMERGSGLISAPATSVRSASAAPAGPKCKLVAGRMNSFYQSKLFAKPESHKKPCSLNCTHAIKTNFALIMHSTLMI